MFYPLLDLIVCPNCKSDLTLLLPTEQQQQTTMRMRRAKRLSRKGAAVGLLPSKHEDTALWHLLSPLAMPSSADSRDREVNVLQGILVCLHCERWYPIRDGLPELLPDHLRNWDEDRNWLITQRAGLVSAGLTKVWEPLFVHAQPSEETVKDEGAHYKKAEMSVTQRSLPEGFFTWGLVAPFLAPLPNFSLDLLARFVTTGSRLDCGINGLVLDLGVGVGWTTEWLVRLGYQTIGIDICRDYILAGLPRMGSHLPHLLVGDIENLPLCDECVEAVLSFDAFHHVPDRHRAMKELGRVMRPGTKMVMVEPGAEHENAPISVAVMQQHGILERGFDQKALTGHIENTSLGDIRHYRTDVHPHDIFTLRKSGLFEPDSLTPRILSAEIVVQPASASVMVGTKPDLMIWIKNTGDTIWLNSTFEGVGEVHLGANLFDNNRTFLLENYAQVLLPRPVRPGQRIQLQCALPPIRQPGSYLVELDMVVDGLLWFKSYAFQPVLWPLTVVCDGLVKESKGAVIAETDRRIIPILLSPELTATEMITYREDKTARPSFTQFIHIFCRNLRANGPVALAHQVLSYLRSRLFRQ